MATQVQWRGGSTAEHSTFTGAAREVTVDTQKKTLVVHDGSTAGGEPLLREDQVNLPTSVTNGISVPSTNNVAISTNGSGRLFIDSSGAAEFSSSIILQNTTSALNIKNAGGATRNVLYQDSSNVLNFGCTDGPIAFLTGSGSQVERMRLDSSGRLGLGTSSPGATLQIGSGSGGGNVPATSKLMFGANNSIITFLSAGDTSSIDGEIGAWNTVYNHQNSKIVFDKPANNLGQLLFFTQGGTGITERLRIDYSGRVGIGTSVPGQRLEVQDAASDTGQVRINGTGAGGLFAGVNSSGAGYIHSNANALVFGSSGGNVLAERARIDGSGRLLVGTSSSPSAGLGQYARLVVQGYVGGSNNMGTVAIQRGTDSYFAEAGIGRITFNDNSGNTYGNIECIVDGTPGASDYPGRLVFSTTADGASSPTERMRITNSGTVLVGRTTNTSVNAAAALQPSNFAVEVASDTTGSWWNRTDSNAAWVAQRFHAQGSLSGFIQVNTSSVTYSTTSDYRLKENVAPLTGAADRVNQLQVHRFNFISEPGKTVEGFLAHEAQAVVPECATGTKDEVDADGNPVYQGIDQSKLVPLLTAALQEALAKIETLEARLTAAGI